MNNRTPEQRKKTYSKWGTEPYTASPKQLWGDFFRLIVVSIWFIYILATHPQSYLTWGALLGYSLFAAFVIWLKKTHPTFRFTNLFTIIADFALLSWVIHSIGSQTSQITVYYLVVLIGYQVQEGKRVGFGALIAALTGYLTVLLLEKYGVIPYAPQLSPSISKTIPLEGVLPSFIRIAIALISAFAFLSITAHKLERHIQTEKALTKAKHIAEQRTEKLQKQFETSQRLESLGRLAGGVAHDFNNLLTGILSYAQFLKEDLSEDAAQQKDINVIIDTSKRAAKLTGQLLAFGRKQIIRPKVINMNKVVRNTEEILKRTIGENIATTIVDNPNLGNIKADPSQMEQVLINLVVNAKDAMPKGGRLTIQTENTDILPNDIIQYPELTEGPHIRILVGDTGHGISPHNLGKIFEPFYTTKPKGEGTGLGLSTVYGIVRQNNGHISVASTPNKGTIFTILFPRVYEEASSSLPPAPVPTGEKETILLAEDEDVVRASVKRILNRQNYTVLEAASGEEALTLASQYPRTINLLLTDVIMTGISGEILAARLKESRPDISVLFMSGYTEDAIVNKGVLKDGTAFMSKPFSADQLLSEVRRVLTQTTEDSG